MVESGVDNAPITTDSSTSSTIQSLGIDDPQFLNSLLGSVDVDVNDPLIKAALAQLMGSETQESGDSKGGAKKRKNADEEDEK
jgi:hypothetical protein